MCAAICGDNSGGGDYTFLFSAMKPSEAYLYRCLETMKADPNLSDETKILMFMEYARLVMKEK